MQVPGTRPSFLIGLFLTTLATLLLELLDTRLLSVLTWYHLSFFAVSSAMFGMAAGAVRVYLAHEAFEGELAPAALARHASMLALAIPLFHVVNLCIPIRADLGATNIAALTLSTVALAVPFYVSGIVVAIALTRIPGRSGLIYAVDLLGAAFGSLLILALLEGFSISSVALFAGAIAAAGAICFRRFAGRPVLPVAALAALLLLGGLANDESASGLRVLYPKGQPLPFEVEHEFWTIHGQVVGSGPLAGAPQFWGPGRGAGAFRASRRILKIDGAAITTVTGWNGDLGSLEWVQYDVTSLPYHLRKGADVAVIGVGGGRDLLTALWARSRSVVGVEINSALLHLLEGPLRDYAKLAMRDDVTLVHDEGRSYFTRVPARFDIIQMSLIDTWAATGAGAFTLSENGLYTLEGWRVFLAALKPGGIFSVSRWYSAERASETSRLLGLARAALLERGVRDARRHMAVVTGGRVATLIVSVDPLPRADVAALERAARRFGFRVLFAPGLPPADRVLDRIISSGTPEGLERALVHPDFDYAVPTDQRPYFFNILKPTRIFSTALDAQPGVLAQGNLLATSTLVILWILALLGVAIVILGPLLRSGLPRMDGRSFGQGLAYFSLIGLGFMFVQIPLIQRFSIYLGHPTYTVAIILFSMILATGIGSYLSDLIDVEGRVAWLVAIPLSIGAILLGTTLSIQPIIDSTIQRGLLERSGIVIALVSLVALPLGTCFPLGLRLVRRVSEDALPWMWGVNGACGVLASVSAVAVSMWSGINTSLLLATLLYTALVLPALALWRRGARAQSPAEPPGRRRSGARGV
jgi:spermidine synthase